MALYGVGINDANYSVTKYILESGKYKLIWTCPYYSRWKNMLVRCYSKAFQKTSPTYLGCEVHPEWYLFSNFKSWMETQDWDGKQLDKDLLFRGNKVYGPQTCVFVSTAVNNFMTESTKARGADPIGVSFYKRYNAFISSANEVEYNKRITIGIFPTAEDAFDAWLVFKVGQAKILASKQTDQRVAKALVERYENYKTDIH